MNQELEKCPICERKPNTIETITEPSLGHHIECEVCGNYKLKHLAESDLQNREYENKKYIISGYIREATENGKTLLISRDSIKHIINSSIEPNNPFESIDRIILYIRDKTETSDAFVKIIGKTDYPIAYARNEKEFEYFLKTAIDLGYLEIGPGSKFRLGIRGWKRLDELSRRVIDSSQAFVAMWFDAELEKAWEEGFKKAFEGTDFDPYRVDLVEHNKKIDDKIISEIIVKFCS